MQPICVLMYGMTGGLLRSILADLVQHEPDMRLVEADGGEELVAAVRRSGASAVLLAELPLEPDRGLTRLFEAMPAVRVLQVRADGKEVLLHDLRPSVRSMGHLRPREVAAVLRGDIHRRSP